MALGVHTGHSVRVPRTSACVFGQSSGPSAAVAGILLAVVGVAWMLAGIAILRDPNGAQARAAALPQLDSMARLLERTRYVRILGAIIVMSGVSAFAAGVLVAVAH
jgi:hypothetical protein